MSQSIQEQVATQHPELYARHARKCEVERRVYHRPLTAAQYERDSHVTVEGRGQLFYPPELMREVVSGSLCTEHENFWRERRKAARR